MKCGRRAFTLIELMIATAITTLVTCSLLTLFTGMHRLIRRAYAESELSLRLRQARERLLFQSLREGGSVQWGGLLSAEDTKLAGDRVSYTAVGIQKESGSGMERGNQWWTGGTVDASCLADRNIYFVTLQDEQAGLVRTERVAIPVFGTEQYRNTASIFHDNL